MKLPEEENSGDEEAPSVDHKNVMGCSRKRLLCGDHPKSNGQDADLYKAGDTTQVTVAGPEPIQQQNDSTHALIDNTAKREQVIDRQGNEVFHPDEGWKKMELSLKMIKVYKEHCRRNGKGGLYDAFINEIEGDKLLLHKYVDSLEQYWEPRVQYMEKNPQIRGTLEWCELLRVGNQVRILIEPLKIAWCFHKKRRSNYSRPNWLRLLEKWQKNGRKRNPQPRAGLSNAKRQKIHIPLREDSCFWVRVEKVRKLLSSGGPSDDSERKELLEVDDFVMGLIDNSAVSADIFLENSTYMQWWRESEAIWEKQMMEHPRHGGLVKFMKNDPRKNYLNGVNSDENLPDTSD